MALPILDHRDLGNFDAALDISPREAFYADTDGALKVHIGAQFTAWHGDDAETGGCWDYNLGRWVGPGPCRAVPRNLRIEGATVDSAGTYPVAAISVSTAFAVLCGLLDYAGLKFPCTLTFILYNAADGTITQQVAATMNATADSAVEPVAVAEFAGVPLGSYQLCAHISSAFQTPITAAFYEELTGLDVYIGFEYDENGTTYFWDYRRNLGRKPLANTHPLKRLRAAVLRSNTQLDRPEWAGYVVSGEPDEGEWSFLRVKAGAGAWTAGAAVLPNPGAALLRETTDPLNWPAVPFDTMARSISAATVIRWGNGDDTAPGDQIIAGTLATESGPVSAFWILHDDATATLMAWNRDPSDGMCQCAKRNHGPNTMAEQRDGTLLFLSECSLQVYDPQAASLDQRLPGYPFNTLGKPGGYSLRLVDDKPNFFTENFNTPDAEHFYNRYQEFLRGRRSEGPGTPWHGRDCSTVRDGYLWAFSQVGAFGDDDAQQYLSRMSEGRWDRSRTYSFPTANYNWKQIVKCAGKLLFSGTRPVVDTETEEVDPDIYSPCWGIDNNVSIQEYACPFVPRYMTVTKGDGGRETVLCIARKVTDAALEPEWHILQVFPQPAKICAFYDADNKRFAYSITRARELGLDPAKLPAFLLWHPDGAWPAGGYWKPVEEEPETGTWMVLSTTTFLFLYTMHAGQDLPYDPDVWGQLCLSIYDDGSIGPGPFPPDPGCTDADCVIDKLPDGSHYKVIVPHLNGREWDSIQVGDMADLDVSRMRALEELSLQYPIIWARIDSDAAQDDLTTYTINIRHFNRMYPLPETAYEKVEVVILYTDDLVPVWMAAVDER